MKKQQSHGNGRSAPGDFQGFGEGTHIEAMVPVFHGGNVQIGDHSAVGAGAGGMCDLPDHAVAADIPTRLLHKRV